MPSLDLCIDANVFVAALCPNEIDHEQASKLIQKIDSETPSLWEPEIVLFEVATAFHKKKVQREIDEEAAEDLMDLFFRLPLLLQWQSHIVKRAYKIADLLPSKGISDSSYLALAEMRDIPLITLDEQLLTKGRKIFRKIFTPEEFLSQV